MSEEVVTKSSRLVSLKSVCRRRSVLFTAGLLLGILGLLVIRFVSYAPEHVHYHANFAVYLNGVRDEFKGAQYYQAVSICSADKGITIPQQRAHMHDNLNSLIHVHDHAVTWGQFFENLGWTIGPDFVQTDDGTLYKADGDSKLHLVINSQDYTDLNSIPNVIIKDKDRLLVSYGNIDDKTLAKEFNSVPSTAEHADNSKDPASCSGAEVVTTKERLHHLF